MPRCRLCLKASSIESAPINPYGDTVSSLIPFQELRPVAAFLGRRRLRAWALYGLCGGLTSNSQIRFARF